MISSPPKVFAKAATSFTASFVQTDLKSCLLLSLGCACANSTIAEYSWSLLRLLSCAVKRSVIAAARDSHDLPNLCREQTVSSWRISRVAHPFAHLAKGAGFDFALPGSPNRPTEGHLKKWAALRNRRPPAIHSECGTYKFTIDRRSDP